MSSEQWCDVRVEGEADNPGSSEQSKEARKNKEEHKQYTHTLCSPWPFWSQGGFVSLPVPPPPTWALPPPPPPAPSAGSRAEGGSLDAAAGRLRRERVRPAVRADGGGVLDGRAGRRRCQQQRGAGGRGGGAGGAAAVSLRKTLYFYRETSKRSKSKIFAARCARKLP